MLYSKFVRKVLKRLNRKFNQGSNNKLRFIIWDDMFRGWSGAQLDMLKVNGKHLAEPCIWDYLGDKNIFDSITCNQSIGNTMVNFEKIWVASAYKGCRSPSTFFVDHELRLQNQYNWLEFARKSHFRDKIEGIILTGWSRFTHETVLCELLPMSIPSINLCLSVIDKQQLNFEVLFQELMKKLLINPKCLLNDSIARIFDVNDLAKFEEEHPFISCMHKQSRQMVLCNDAFEIGWTLCKANFAYDQCKMNFESWSMINHEKYMTMPK